MTQIHIPRIVIAALKGGAGKTFLSTGISAALHRRGLSLAVFKKGPDYIDAGWLGLAAGEDCHNLDTYLMDPHVVTESFRRRSVRKQIAVVEGNRGLFDGVNVEGTYSTAELAKLLQAPVILGGGRGKNDPNCRGAGAGMSGHGPGCAAQRRHPQSSGWRTP